MKDEEKNMEKKIKNFEKTSGLTIDDIVKGIAQANTETFFNINSLLDDTSEACFTVCKAYAILFSTLEKNIGFNFLGCVIDICLHLKNPEAAEKFEEVLASIKDDLNLDEAEDDDDFDFEELFEKNKENIVQ
jgi:hypothetical protein